jgi:hypothetical protein
MTSRKHFAFRLTTLCALSATALFGGCSRETPTEPAANAAQVQQVFDACSQEMLRNTCRVTNDKSSSAAPAASSVFVAGVGQIDAAAYQSLREAGDAMCGQVRRSCTEHWGGSACRTARSLWTR